MSAFGGQLEPIEVDAEGDAKEGSPTELAQSSGDEMETVDVIIVNYLFREVRKTMN